MDAELLRIPLRSGWRAGSGEPSRSRLNEWFLPGRRQAPCQRSSLFFPEVHDELTRSWSSPYSARLRTSVSSALITVNCAEEKGYEKMPPQDESVATHLCPPSAIGWKARATLPSKPCRTTVALAGRSYTSAGQAASALHSMVVLQVFQAQLLSSMNESEPNPATLRELRSATDLALHATKTTAQAIGRSMASLVVLERHLWLTLTEIKDAEKVFWTFHWGTEASLQPLITPFSPGCGGRYVCSENSDRTSAQATARCYSRKNKTQTFSEREQTSSSMPHKCPAPVQSATRVYPTPRHAKPIYLWFIGGSVLPARIAG